MGPSLEDLSSQHIEKLTDTSNGTMTEIANISNAGSSMTAQDTRDIKRLKFKADFILLPILSFAYLLNSLDRSNVSNAHTAGFVKDLHLASNQFNQILTYYSIPFIVCGPIITMTTKAVGAHWTLPVLLLAFGAASLAGGFAKDFKDIVICRVFVGAFEAGFLASVVYYLSTWYTKGELATRLGIFYAALVSSSAFGGLFAYGMFHIQGGSYFQWSYLFFLEGGLTMLWALVLFALPASPKTAWFLNERERELATLRILQDSPEALTTKFSWKEAVGEFLTPHGYIRVLVGFIAGTVLSSNASFLAIIVKLLGFSVVKTNLYTVAPALTGAVFLVCCGLSADRYKARGLHISFAAILSLIGYIILASASLSNTALLYFAIFLCTMGAYPASPIGSAWIVANTPNLNARALTTAMGIAAGNCGSLLSSNIYLSQEAPRYITSIRVNIGMTATIIALCISYSIWMKWENRRRDKAADLDVNSSRLSAAVLNTNHPSFRFSP